MDALFTHQNFVVFLFYTLLFIFSYCFCCVLVGGLLELRNLLPFFYFSFLLCLLAAFSLFYHLDAFMLKLGSVLYGSFAQHSNHQLLELLE